MARTALIIGGSGQIGRALAPRLVQAGWRVIAGQRGAFAPGPGCEAVELDREDPASLARAIGPGVDALIDTVAFDETHARQLLQLQDDVGALVVISSASVYRDEAGRTIDEARQTGFPVFPEPIAEDHPTVEPGPLTYSTRKVALEQMLLQHARRPVVILRPGAIYGPGSRHPREWFFVKRILDGRTHVPLAWNGANRFHTTASGNLAELVRVALDEPRTQVLHAADPQALRVSRIGEAIRAAMAAPLELVPFAGAPVGTVGGHPWGVAHPIVLDMSRAAALGYRPVGGYESLIGPACRAAEAAARDGVAFVPYLATLFDYAAEDAWLAARDAGAGTRRR